MKTTALLVVIVLISVAYADFEEDRAKYKKAHKECQDDPATHLDEELMKKSAKGEKVDSSAFGGHALCMSTKIGLQDEHGKVNVDTLKKYIGAVITDPAELDASVTKCSIEKDTKEETAAEVFRCVHVEIDANLKKHGHAHGHGHHHHH